MGVGGWIRQGARVAVTAALAGTAVVGAAVVPAAASGAPVVGTAVVPAAASGAPVVGTDNGPVRGLVAAGMRQFLGIPYAAAPVGALRWRPPQPAAGWSGVRDATRFGAQCAQPGSSFGTASAAEDCLFLNVFAPAEQGRLRRAPVMVWIHGGGLVAGGSDPYDPTRLVAQGTVVVTINYRLGVLGFLAHPALTAEAGGASGNYGLMDQQAALRWVRRNIARFGGDLGNVTIFGESAGGLSVHAQLASPGAAGLFHRAIGQSGAYSMVQPTLAAAQATGAGFATRAGCADQTAGCLRGLPVATVLANQPSQALPTVDGRVLPRSVRAAFDAGRLNRVPVVEGSNLDEWRLFVAQAEAASGQPLTAAGYVPAIAATLGVPAEVAGQIAARYPLSAYSSPSVALGAVGTDAIFACNARTSARLLSRWVPTYQYEFADRDAPNLFFPGVSFPTGAYHAAELQYLFDLPVAGEPTADQQRLARAMVRSWTRFARAGNPGAVWPRYGPADRYLSLQPPAPRRSGGFAAAHQCAFWAALQGG